MASKNDTNAEVAKDCSQPVSQIEIVGGQDTVAKAVNKLYKKRPKRFGVCYQLGAKNEHYE